MKVLHVIVGLDAGGAELMLKRLVSALRDHGIQSTIVSLTTKGTLGNELQDAGFVVKSLGMRGPASVLWSALKLRRMILDERPDVVQTWMYHADLIGGVAARAAGTRNVVWNIRQTDLSAGISRRTRLIRSVCALVSRRLPRRIVAVAHAAMRMHVEAGYDNSRMVVIPNGFDLVKFRFNEGARRSIRSSLGVQDNVILIGSLGRFNPIKDHSNFIAAATLVASRHERVKFVMVGRGIAGNRTLQLLVQAGGQPQKFLLLDHTSDAPGYLSALDVFCLHSRTEGFPNALGEAMATGRYCVTTDVGDAALMLGNLGQVVPKENPIALAAAIEAAMALDGAAREEVASKGRDRIQSNYSIAAIARQYADIYWDLTGRAT